MLDVLMTVVLVAENGRGSDPNIVRPGWLALGIVALMGVAVFFLARSLAKHQRRAREPWEGDAPESQDPPERDDPPQR